MSIMWLAWAKSPDVENFQACYQTYYEYDVKELMELLWSKFCRDSRNLAEFR